jgi:hypothetical protein
MQTETTGAAATENALDQDTTEHEESTHPEHDTGDEEQGSQDNDNESAKEERKPNHQQRRWERLIREKYEAKARAEYLEKMLAMQQSQRGDSSGSDRPSTEQFESQEDYVKALVQHELTQRERASQAQERAQQDQQQAARREKLLSEAEELGDFDRDDFLQSVQISPLMADAILDSDIGAKIVVHLNAHPQEASRISALPPARQAAEIGKLEMKLTSAPPKKSAAPKPIQPLQGKAPSSDLSDELSPDEWMRRRNAQIFGKR